MGVNSFTITNFDGSSINVYVNPSHEGEKRIAVDVYGVDGFETETIYLAPDQAREVAEEILRLCITNP
jgi:hypothetical protein